MKEFQAFLEGIADPSKRERIEEILRFIKEKFPHLKPVQILANRKAGKKMSEKVVPLLDTAPSVVYNMQTA